MLAIDFCAFSAISAVGIGDSSGPFLGGGWRAGSWSPCFDLMGCDVGGPCDCWTVWRHSLSKTSHSEG